MTDTQPTDLRQLRLELTVDGRPAVATVSPCSWMYPGYGLQVKVEIAGGKRFLNSRKPFAEANEKDVRELASQLSIVPCKRCRGDAIADAKSNRNGLCEACFMGDLDAEMAAARAKQAAKEAAYDRRMHAKGYRFKTIARVHPDGGGDDRELVWYEAERPAADVVSARLAKLKSAILTDFRTDPLEGSTTP